jgi:CRISPR/Cas system-associated endonuclease Cas3-HD
LTLDYKKQKVVSMNKIGNVINAMIDYYTGDARRIQHFLKVYGFAKAIGEIENLSKELQETLEVAAVVHDIGIKVSEEKYHSSAGNYQQMEGPPVAKEMLEMLGYDEEFIERVCYLIAHHHTYNNMIGMDYQILVEADFLVNISEDHMGSKEINSIREKIFRTKTGLTFLQKMYLS